MSVKKKWLLILLGGLGILLLGSGIAFQNSNVNNKESSNNKEAEQEGKEEQEDNTEEDNIVKWGTSSPIPYMDSEYGQLEVTTYGKVSYELANGETINNILEENMYNATVTVISTRVQKYKNGSYTELIHQFLNDKEDILKEINEYLNEENLTITDIEIIAINLTEESQNKISEQDREKLPSSNQESYTGNYESINNYKFKATSTIKMQGTEYNAVIDGVVDEKNQKEYMKTNISIAGIELVMETYTDFANGYTYSLESFTNTWQKIEGASMFVDLESIMQQLDTNESVTKIDDSKYKIKLSKEEVNEMVGSVEELGSFEVTGDLYITVYVSNKYITKLEYDFSGLITNIEKFTMVIELLDFNKAGDVVIPSSVTGQ